MNIDKHPFGDFTNDRAVREQVRRNGGKGGKRKKRARQLSPGLRLTSFVGKWRRTGGRRVRGEKEEASPRRPVNSQTR